MTQSPDISLNIALVHKKSRVLLVDADSKIPNLALMKLSRYCKEKGAGIDLIRGIPTTRPLGNYDVVFVSCVFFQNRKAVMDYSDQFDCTVVIGGSGVSNEVLPRNVEFLMPDYDLYGEDYSIGFTSRGCIRKCKFCVVPEKEGMIRSHQKVSEFHDPRHKKVVLMDNNLQASSTWRENLEYIIENGLKVNYNQGLDIRLMDEEFVKVLAETKYYSFSFKTRSVHVSFDSLSYRKQFVKGMDLLTSYIRPDRISVYVLVGFGTTKREDYERCDLIEDYGARPFIMPFNGSRDSYYRHLARYYNRLYYQFVPREGYEGGVLA